MKDDLVAVILAAGKGTRMQPFSTHYPKPALPICNKPLLQYQIEMFRELGITEVFIVIGHLGHEIAQQFGDGSRLGVKLRYVEQTKILGIAAALGQLEPFVGSPMFLALGDIFFKAENLDGMWQMMRERQASAVLAVKEEASPEAVRRNFTVLHDAEGRVRRVIEKPRHVTTNLKGCGLYLFDLPVFDAIRRTPRTAMRDEYEITDTIQIMVDDDLLVLSADVVKWDVNLTYPADVLTCNLFELDQLGGPSLIADGAEIHPGARIERSVIGAGAKVVNPIKVSNCVVFPDSVVTKTKDLDHFVVTPEHLIDCRVFIDQ